MLQVAFYNFLSRKIRRNINWKISETWFFEIFENLFSFEKRTERVERAFSGFLSSQLSHSAISTFIEIFLHKPCAQFIFSFTMFYSLHSRWTVIEHDRVLVSRIILWWKFILSVLHSRVDFSIANQSRLSGIAIKSRIALRLKKILFRSSRKANR